MENLTVASIIKLLPESNDQIQKFGSELMSYLDSGDINPLDVLICLKGFEKVVKNVKDELNELCVSECEKYSEKDISYKGVELSVVQTGVKYHYGTCNDFVLKEFEDKKVLLDNDIKKRQTFLKSIDPDNGIDVLDESTGELVKILPPVKSSTTTAKLTFKQKKHEFRI